MRHRLGLVVGFFGILMFSGLSQGCQRSSANPALEERDPRNAAVARSYGWRARAERPQPQWHPRENLIVVRSDVGLGLLREGAGGERYITLRGGQEPWDPQWWGPNQVVFGPAWRQQTRQFIMPSGGLVLAEVGLDGFTGLSDLLDKGYHPQPWDDSRLLAQWGEDLILLTRSRNSELKESYFGKGFRPTAQPHGPGMSYQVTPYPERDYWTGRPEPELVVRWRPGVVDSIRQAFDGRWTPDGRLLATLRGEGESSLPSVMILDKPGAVPRLLANGAHQAAAHPRFALAAVADAEDGIRLVTYDAAHDVRLSRRGRRPQWNADGTRLLIEEPQSQGPPFMRVLVVVWREDTAAEGGAAGEP